MTVYPAQIDTSTTLPAVVDNITPVQAFVANRLRDTILAIEEELGVKPSGIYGNVRTRLDMMDKSLISLGGDIGGTATNPIVIGIQGRSVSSAAPNVGDALLWNGSAWMPHALPTSGSGDGYVHFSGDISGTPFLQAVIGIQGRPINNTAPATGQPLVWNGSAWAPSATINVITKVIVNISNADYSVVSSNTDTFVGMFGLTANRAVFLPLTPFAGQSVTVKDIDGSLSSFNITINGNGKNIDGVSTYTLSNIQGPMSAITIIYTGAAWAII